MANAVHAAVCTGIVPDPLQTLEPITRPNGPGLKNEMVLPLGSGLRGTYSLYEAASLAIKNSGSFPS
jgi:electron transfer flavoprotein beta subunit